eukprot:14380717-Alexandrium_andersonii.AAC.1
MRASAACVAVWPSTCPHSNGLDPPLFVPSTCPHSSGLDPPLFVQQAPHSSGLDPTAFAVLQCLLGGHS